jgi:hypothetical protein
MKGEEVWKYWQKVHAVEATIAQTDVDSRHPSVVIISRATAQGGKAGVLKEADRRTAARLIVEGLADLATPQQAAEFRRKVEAAHKAEDCRQREVAETLEVARRLGNQRI